MDSQVIRFFRSLITIFLAIIICDFAMGKLLSLMYFKQKSGLLYRTTYVVDSTTAPYLVFGSSRANHHYSSSIFETRLGSDFYNCGRDGEGILYSCAMISATIGRYTPKRIIIDIQPDEFSKGKENDLASLLPYHQNKAVKHYIKLNSHFESIKLASQIYPYNSLLTNLLNGFKKRKNEDYKGFVKKENSNAESILNDFEENKEKDAMKTAEFISLIEVLNSRRIPVLLVISPLHNKYKTSTTYNTCLYISRKFKNTNFLSFVNAPEWQRNNLFSDNSHLNLNGATTFSDFLSKKIITDSLLTAIP